MEIVVHNNQLLCSIQNETIAPIAEVVLQNEGAACDELHVHFVDTKTICELHEHFFQDPSPTDCISIQVDDLSASPCFLGEIFISPQAALDYCKEKDLPLEEELTLYLVHGLLHLLGYDDLNEEDEKKMRLAEKRQMNYLKEHQLLIKV